MSDRRKPPPQAAGPAVQDAPAAPDAEADEATAKMPSPADLEETGRLPVRTDEAPSTFSWRVAAVSWLGLVRRNNQDSAFSSPRLVAVADGMGGEASGDVASQVASRRLWLASANPSAGALMDAVAAASDDIAELVRSNPDMEGMGTTICGASFDGHELDFVHVGDSRAYRLRNGKLKQLTHDHSFVQQLIDQGHLTPDEARVHPKRSLVLRVVNGTSIGTPDHFNEVPRLGDRYLFCSDGLSSYVEGPAIQAALGKPGLEQAIDDMLEAAAAAGAPDNVSMVVTEIVPKDDVLDADKPQLWGAASVMKPPSDDPSGDSGDIVSQLARWGVKVPPASAGKPDDASPRPARKPRWPRRLAAGLAAGIVLVAAVFGGLAWLHGQYFIGVVDDRAAIFQGVPYRVGPVYLSTIQQTSTVSLGDLPVYYADQVRTWQIRATSLDGAEQSLAKLKAKADACVAARTDPSQATPGESCP